MKEREQSDNKMSLKRNPFACLDMVFVRCRCFLVAILKVESSGWQEAHPGPAPIRRCGDGSLPFAALDLGLVGRGRGEEFHLGGLEGGGLGSSQRCLQDEKQIELLACNCPCLFSEGLPPVSSVPGGGAQHGGGALVGPSL